MTQPLKFIAAAMPRSVRQARLSYLPTEVVIGSVWRGGPNQSSVYDIIMLPEAEFIRARHYLTNDQAGMVKTLVRTKTTPIYIPQEVHEVVIQPDEPHPHELAKSHFLIIFKLDTTTPVTDTPWEEVDG